MLSILAVGVAQQMGKFCISETENIMVFNMSLLTEVDWSRAGFVDTALLMQVVSNNTSNHFEMMSSFLAKMSFGHRLPLS